jgi:hypothetical protein
LKTIRLYRKHNFYSETGFATKHHTKYLSKVINEQKEKRFVQYINELKITVCNCKAQPVLQNYTIASLASEFVLIRRKPFRLLL